MYKNVGKVIREFRTKNDLSQRDLGDKLSINPQVVYDVERGKIGIPLEAMKILIKKHKGIKDKLKKAWLADKVMQAKIKWARLERGK